MWNKHNKKRALVQFSNPHVFVCFAIYLLNSQIQLANLALENKSERNHSKVRDLFSFYGSGIVVLYNSEKAITVTLCTLMQICAYIFITI